MFPSSVYATTDDPASPVAVGATAAYLNEHDTQVLRSRAISPEVAETRGYRTGTAKDARAAGFMGQMARDGLLIPGHNTQGEVTCWQLRPHDPPLDDKGKPRKYLWAAGTRMQIDVPPVSLPYLRDINVPLIVTESILKADAIQSAIVPGTACVIAISGVYGWRSEDMPLAGFADIPWKKRLGDRVTFRRTITIAFDSDTRTNQKVAQARWDLTEFLRRKQARVSWLDVPAAADGSKQGIDDALAAGTDLWSLMADAYPAPDSQPGAVPARPRSPDVERRQRSPNGQASQSGADMRESGLHLEDFYAYLPKHKYIFRRDGSIWDPAGVNAGLPPVRTEFDEISPGKYLDTTRAVHQMTWIPGHPELIRDALVTAGGLTPAPGKRAYNRYRPPESLPGDAMRAGPWLDHVERLYPDDADHIVSWLAHRTQHPGVKINHALVLGGSQGIGKDTMLDPVVRAVGPHNVADESPATVTGRFNKFLCSVILRVSEARDLGDVDRYGFYEHMKAILAAPPDVLSVELKFVDAYPVPNVVGVIFTTNNRHNGLYLPAEDRRHYVAWSELAPTDFDADYFDRLYTWFETGGYGHVAAYLNTCNLDDFNPKAPPPKTDAFWDMVDTGRSPEEAEMRDLLDLLGNPEAVTVPTLRSRLDPNGELWALFNERKFRTQIPHRMADVGYIPVRNPYARDGLWVLGNKKRQVAYALATLSKRDRIAAAGRLS